MANSSVTVTMTIAMDTELADSTDHDLIFGISDNMSFVGFVMFDQDNYDSFSPCRRQEGEKIDGVLENHSASSAPLVNSRTFSSEMKLQFRPAEQWGSCHTEHDGGYTNIATYQNLLDPSNGLFLEMYHNEADEIYRIKYIETNVELD